MTSGLPNVFGNVPMTAGPRESDDQRNPSNGEVGVSRGSNAFRTPQTDAETSGCIIEDSGNGNDAEHLAHLFDRFSTTKGTGMGLGLPIAHTIVEAHNGWIRADNKSTLGGARSRVVPIRFERFNGGYSVTSAPAKYGHSGDYPASAIAHCLFCP